MTHNDILIRIRYALNLKDQEMVDIFKLGKEQLTLSEIRHMLTKSVEDDPQHIVCTNQQLDAFLNGLIIYKRGEQKLKPNQKPRPPVTITSDEHANNIVFKKLKIALTLTSEDILNILDDVDVNLSNSELSAILRKEDHRNYKICGDRYLRNFLKGLALHYREHSI